MVLLYLLLNVLFYSMIFLYLEEFLIFGSILDLSMLVGMKLLLGVVVDVVGSFMYSFLIGNFVYWF